MDAKDMEIQKLRQEAARWRNRALEACGEACCYCQNSEIKSRDVCSGCRIQRIEEEAQK